jgi:hypothetical protein
MLTLTDAWSAQLTGVESPLRELLRDCLAPDPRLRPTAADALARLGLPAPATTGPISFGRVPGHRPPR